MRETCEPWQGLKPEKDLFMGDSPLPSRRRVT